jgi:hypothetical protein
MILGPDKKKISKRQRGHLGHVLRARGVSAPGHAEMPVRLGWYNGDQRCSPRGDVAVFSTTAWGLGRGLGPGTSVVSTPTHQGEPGPGLAAMIGDSGPVWGGPGGCGLSGAIVPLLKHGPCPWWRWPRRPVCSWSPDAELATTTSRGEVPELRGQWASGGHVCFSRRGSVRPAGIGAAVQGYLDATGVMSSSWPSHPGGITGTSASRGVRDHGVLVGTGSWPGGAALAL